MLTLLDIGESGGEAGFTLWIFAEVINNKALRWISSSLVAKSDASFPTLNIS